MFWKWQKELLFFTALARKDYLFADLHNQRKKRGTNWMLEPITVRYNGQHPQEMIVPDQYDGVFFVKNVSPPEYLY
ncbi:MAG: hypothetical protein R2747_15495 [Pyrinomonadaceae bacterium]